MLARSPARIPLAASGGQERSKLAHESDTSLECGFRAHPRSGITSLAGIAEGSTLRLLADNSANSELPVAWDFGDVVAGGWADREKIVADLAPELRFLVVTEGSSDAKILAHAFKMLCCPAIAFFCSGAELQRWLSGQSPPRAGNLLTLDEALEVGRALFEPVFAEAKPN